LAAFNENSPVAILGAGPVGLCTMLAAQARGCGRVYVTDRIRARLDVAEKLGAYQVGNPAEDDVVKLIEESEPLGIPVVFECSGDADALGQAVELLAPGGMLVITGIPVGSRISLNIDLLRRKEITIRNVRRQNCSVEDTINLLASGEAGIEPLITHRMSLADAKAAFDLVAGYKDGVVKAMVII
jgi:L-iditol 2-dehydrogenase